MEGGLYVSNQGKATNGCEGGHNHGRDLTKGELVSTLLCLHERFQEEPDVRLAIQEALSMMVGAYANLQGALLTLMEALVAAYIGKVGRAFKQYK